MAGIMALSKSLMIAAGLNTKSSSAVRSLFFTLTMRASMSIIHVLGIQVINNILSVPICSAFKNECLFCYHGLYIQIVKEWAYPERIL